MPISLILLGGFLGAGKTTLMGKAAARLTKAGKKVGLITNDQAADLVDTEILRKQGLGVQEVAGGCFCCRFSDLLAAGKKLVDMMQPDVIIAEAVGSCTDISATVIQPLKKLYSDVFKLAPFSVLIDPLRLEEALDLRPKTSFDPTVFYIFGKQMEEADFIVLNKSDLVSEARLAELKALAAEKFPGAPVLSMSALNDVGVDTWLSELEGTRPVGRRVLDVNYDLYARGEEVLGWLNASVQLASANGADWHGLCLALVQSLREALKARGAEVAHLKLFLTGRGGSVVANLTRSDDAPFIRGQLAPDCGGGILLLNARVHMDPEGLKQIVEQTLAEVARSAKVTATVSSIQSFKPGRPQPTHRMAGE